MRSDDFLDKYKSLEEALSLKYGLDEKAFGSPVVKFINDKESKNYREKLDLCREIRNFLSHHSDIDGEPIVEPSESIIRFLDEVIQFVERPPLAIGFCTLYENVLKTSPTQKALTVMKKMQRMGFSHVPVVSEGEFVGVFSISTVFSYALKYGITENLTIGDFEEFLSPDQHENERFKFMHKDVSLFDVRAEFEKKPFRSKKLAVVFLTDNGTPNGRIVGLLTPWDVINA